MPGFMITGQEADGPSNTVEVARKHRFRFTMIGPLQRQICIYAYKSTRPTCEIDRIVLHHGQEEIYLPGKERWLPIEITFYDAFEESSGAVISQILYEWRAQTTLLINSSAQGRQSSYKQDCTLQMLDSHDNPIWTYYMYDTWPSKVTPSDVASDESALGDITMILEMSKAEEGGGGIQVKGTQANCQQ